MIGDYRIMHCYGWDYFYDHYTMVARFLTESGTLEIFDKKGMQVFNAVYETKNLKKVASVIASYVENHDL